MFSHTPDNNSHLNPKMVFAQDLHASNPSLEILFYLFYSGDQECEFRIKSSSDSESHTSSIITDLQVRGSRPDI